MKQLKNYFLTGLFILIPIGASTLILGWLFNLLDGWTTPITERLFGLHIPGLGIVITGLVIIGFGAMASNMMGRWILKGLDTLLLEVPILRSVYGTSKQFMELFNPTHSQAFRHVVWVTHPRTGAGCLGFVTNEFSAGGETWLSIYVPTNHVYLGDTFYLKPADVKRVSISIEQAIQAHLTAGAALPDPLPLEPWIATESRR